MTSEAFAVIVATALAVSFSSLSTQAGEVKLRPVDEAARDPFFLAFREALLEAVVRRDAEYVVAQADPDIKLSFGGDYGRETFRRWLTEGGWQDAEIYWQELETALKLGGVFSESGEFCTPYLACLPVSACPDCSGYDSVYVLREDVKAYATMDTGSPIVATLSYDVLPMADWGDVRPSDTEVRIWVPVELPGGGTGFIMRPDYRMAVDFRAYFSSYDGAWHMTIFVAGD